MTKLFTFTVLLLILSAAACAPRASAAPTPLPATATIALATLPATPAAVNTPEKIKTYTNSAFGLTFTYPSAWFGPEETISDQTLRLEVGSDQVYPYGERPEQPSEVKNSYNIVIQYTKNNQNQAWDETYPSLTHLKDGESLSGTRGKIIRVRPLNLGKLKGFETIATLSDTAQTDPVYNREVILKGEQGDLLTITGTPNNVEVASGADWREVYRSIDAANQAVFHQIVESIQME